MKCPRPWPSSACWACCFATNGSGAGLFPSFPTKPAPSGWIRYSREIGIYSPKGQRYEPVDSASLLYYRESTDGQILEEGITEAGAMSSLIAAGTSYSTHGVPMMPFFIYYSMFGLQRIGDLVWAAADMRTRGFMLGATAGRTTLNGEGLQHQDGHSHILASTVPTLAAYDPAFGYEIAVIVQDGMRRMYAENEDLFYLSDVVQRELRHARDAVVGLGRYPRRGPRGAVPLPDRT